MLLQGDVWIEIGSLRLVGDSWQAGWIIDDHLQDVWLNEICKNKSGIRYLMWLLGRVKMSNLASGIECRDQQGGKYNRPWVSRWTGIWHERSLRQKHHHIRTWGSGSWSGVMTYDLCRNERRGHVASWRGDGWRRWLGGIGWNGVVGWSLGAVMRLQSVSSTMYMYVGSTDWVIDQYIIIGTEYWRGRAPAGRVLYVGSDWVWLAWRCFCSGGGGVGGYLFVSLSCLSWIVGWVGCELSKLVVDGCL
jgi:hypothetical protein